MLTPRRRLVWDPPRVRAPPSSQHDSAEKKVSWLELFYDLVFVAATAKLAHLAVHMTTHGLSPNETLLLTCNDKGAVNTSHTTGTVSPEEPGVFGLEPYHEMVFSFLLYSYAIWRIWTLEVRFNASLDGGEDILGRVNTGAQIIMIGGLAVSITVGVSSLYSFHVFRLLYSLARIFQLVKFLRITNMPAGTVSIWRQLKGGWVIEIAFTLSSAFITDPANKDIAAALFLAGLFWAAFINRAYFFYRMRDIEPFIRPAAEHLTERFGLFTIIVSGEAAVHVIEGAQYAMEAHITMRENAGKGAFEKMSTQMSSAWYGTLLGFIPIICVWWLYFDSMNERLVGHGHRLGEFLWETAHFGLFIGTTSFAATISLVIQAWGCGEVAIAQGEQNVKVGVRVPSSVAQLMGIMLALVMFCLSWIRHQAVRQFSKDIGAFRWRQHHCHPMAHVLMCGLIATVPYITPVWTPRGLLTAWACISAFMVLYDVVIGYFAEKRIQAKAGGGGGGGGEVPEAATLEAGLADADAENHRSSSALALFATRKVQICASTSS